MPRIVDHDQRRRDLSRAVWELIREEGLKAVTIRAVAAGSGWSSGAVRHYLPTREAILAFAAEELRNEFKLYLQSRPITGDPVVDVRALLIRYLPLDDFGKSMLEIWLAFVGVATSGQSGAKRANVYDDLNEMLTDTIGSLATAGHVEMGDVPTVTVEVHAMLDGLSGHLLLGQVTEQGAEDAIDSWLARVVRPAAE